MIEQQKTNALDAVLGLQRTVDRAERESSDTVDPFVRHVCFYCHHSFDQTKDNPARTDFCAMCGHRGEGIRRRLIKGRWGALHVLSNVRLTRTERT